MLLSTELSTELELRLIERVKRDGPITFRDFMQAALYDPRLGYYNTERLKIGPGGDYYTSSNVHPAFGAVLAHAFVELWIQYPLTLVEIGAGTGQLAFDILSAIRDEHPAIFKDLNYIIVETSPAMIAHQQNKLRGFGKLVQWRALDELERKPVAGIAFSNEFVDAMPVHRVRVKDGCLEEQFVTTATRDGETHMQAVWGKPSSEQLARYVSGFDAKTSGQIVEVNLDAIRWLARMSRAISHGFLVTIDYGDGVEELWSAERTQGTLRTFYKHRLTDSPFERIGEQDITASVNFSALIEYGPDFGFELITFERQTAFLSRMGLIERVAAMHGENESLDDLRQRLAVKNLFVPGGVSDSFRVLIQKRPAAA